MPGRWDHLGTIADRPRIACPKSGLTSQLQAAKQDDRDTRRDEHRFRKEVYRLDKGICRRCLRAVQRSIERTGTRAEVHHVHGRLGKLRYLVRAALLLCADCHELVTGTVGLAASHKLVVVGTKFFRLDKVRLIDARQPVTFAEAAA